MFEVPEEMVMYAFRYTLGRKTYSVSTVSDFLINNWHRFKPSMKERIIEEIEEAIKKGEAGMDMDVKRWQAVLLLESAVLTGENKNG